MRNPFSKTFKPVLLTLSIAGIATGFSTTTLAKGTVKPAAAPQAAAAPEAITWNYDLKAALTVAQSNRRWVLVDCFTQNCGWCKVLDAKVLRNPDVAKALGSHFVWVKCDTDNPTTGTWVKDKYEPEGYPCILILDPYGKEKGRLMGYMPASIFVNRVTQIVSR